MKYDSPALIVFSVPSLSLTPISPESRSGLLCGGGVHLFKTHRMSSVGEVAACLGGEAYPPPSWVRHALGNSS